MENALMKTAEEIILEFQELPPEERQKVVEYVDSSREEAFPMTRYSSEDMAKIDHDLEEAEQGINIEEFSSMEEAIKSLGLT